MIHREAINQPTSRYPRCHCSTIVELPSGDLLAAWYAGSDEARPDVAVLTARKASDADAWESPISVSDTPGKPEGNCVLFVAPDGLLWLIYGVMHGKLDGPPGPGVRWETCDVRCKTSQDEGRTWSETRMLREELGMVPRCKPIVLANGDIVMGFEHKSSYSHFMISEDLGRTWFWSQPVFGAKNEQPTLVQKSDGSLLALLRPDGSYARIAQSISTDNGRTWTPAVNTEFPNPYAAIDMVKLEDGRWVLAFNNHEEHRSPLTLAVSEDEGSTWPIMRDVVTGEGRFAYPAIIQDSQGMLHLTYTHSRHHIGHIVLQPEWIYS